MARVNIVVDDRQAREALAGLIDAVREPKKAFDAIGTLLASRIRSNIAEGHDYTGAPFVPLSPVTLALRRKGGEGAKPLHDTGRLMNSITHQADSDGVDVFTDVEYAAAQQFGNPNNRMFGKAPAPIPARRFFMIDEAGQADIQQAEIDEITDIMGRYLAEAA